MNRFAGFATNEGRAAGRGPSCLFRRDQPGQQRTARRFAAAFIIAFAILGLTAACSEATTSSGPAPTGAGPTGSAAPSATGAMTETRNVAATASLSATVVAPTTMISLTRRVVGFAAGTAARPGPWSPQGEALVAYVVVREPTAAGPIGHLWTVDVATASPQWDSGDMEGPFLTLPMAGWLADGTLVLARQDGPWVRPDGTRVSPSPEIEGQPLAVTVAPDGRESFVEAADGSWLVAADGTAQPVMGRPESGFGAWSWRDESQALALVTGGGEYYALDVVTATAHAIAMAPPAGLSGPIAPPRWLRDGRVLLSNATQVDYEGGTALEHLIAGPQISQTVPINELIGMPPNRAMPLDASSWVSPDGQRIVYPQFTVDRAGSASQTASWLYDVGRGKARRMPILADPVWAPDSRRLAYRADGRLAIWDTATGTSLILTPGQSSSVEHVSWSPDGRWLLFSDSDGALWITQSDGQTFPEQVADHMIWEPAPTWSPNSDRFAATLADGEETARLTLVTVQ
jgi:hypothetical protein